MKTMLLMILCVFTAPQISWADLKFCNKTSAPAHVAVAYVQKDPPGVSTGGDRGVTAEGWWTFAPGECASVTNLDHAGQYWVYYFAHSTLGKWEGSTYLCVPRTPFTTTGAFMRQGDTCMAGRHLERFRRSDTQARNHTINLLAP